MKIIVRGPKLIPFSYLEIAEGARFENPEASEAIEPSLFSSSQSQSLTEELEVRKEPDKPYQTR